MIKRKQVVESKRGERRFEVVTETALPAVRGGEDLIKGTSYEDNWRVQR